MTRMILFAVLLTGPAFAQSAKVVELSAADVARIQSLFNAKQAAEQAWDAALKDVEHKYLSDSREEPDYGPNVGTVATAMIMGGSSIGDVYWRGDGGFSVPERRCDLYEGLSDSVDATELCQKYRARKAAAEKKRQAERIKAEKEEQERIAKLPRKTVYTPKPGWENGFELSEGFRYVVPKPASTTVVSPFSPLINLTGQAAVAGGAR